METLFQFHKGSIKTSTALASSGLSSVFQFHKGSIKTMAQQNTYNQSAISIP